MPTTHPASIADHLAAIKDPRSERSKRHSLHEILVLSICATICGADGFVAIEEFGIAKQDWLRRFLDLPHGIPSPDTLGRVFALIDPAPFERCFVAWMQGVFDATEGEVVPVDDKKVATTARKAALHMLGAWATEKRLLLGALETEARSKARLYRIGVA